MRKGPWLEVKGGEGDPAKAAKEEGLVKLAETHGGSPVRAPSKELSLHNASFHRTGILISIFILTVNQYEYTKVQTKCMWYLF